MTINSPIIIGITGASASGKSSLAKNIISEINNHKNGKKVLSIGEDSYYKSFDELSFEEKKQINYDHPDSFDHKLFAFQLEQILSGKIVDLPTYDYVEYKRSSETIKTNGEYKVIILEGIQLFHDEKMRNLMDIKIFMDTPPDISLVRRIKRDIKERGRTLDYVLNQYETCVRPMYIKFIEPTKKYSDICVLRGGENKIAIEMIKSKINELIS